jgi:Cu-Zn family superoxide dismutase
MHHDHTPDRPSRSRRAAIASATAALALLGTLGTAALAGADDGEGAVRATATLRDPAGEVVGTARFTEDGAGALHVTVVATGLSPGLHGIHVHNVADCAPGDPSGSRFLASGSHHNPLGAQHGSLNPAGPHAGDLPNLQVNPAGVGHVTTVLGLATLSVSASSLFDGNGSAVVVHAGPDDLVTDPTGNSGARVACGVVEAV